MIRNCIYCKGNIDLKKHGLTKYCTSLCRNKDYYLKKQNNPKYENLSENQSRKELSNIDDNSFNEQNNIGNNIDSYSTSKTKEINLINQSSIEEMILPEYYKAILDEKGKNFELQTKINMLELRNESLQKSNQELENEIIQLNMEIEELDNSEEKNNSQIFGMPSSMVQGVLVDLITPHATNIISGFMKKKNESVSS